MASEQSTDIILDLLYGELSADEETAARASVAKDPALAAELAAFESLRGQMGEFLAPEIPRMSVRDSILAEASKQASRKSPDENLPSRRPNSDGAESLGFWRRLGKGKASQLALVATVLLTGVFVMRSGAMKGDMSMAPEMYEPSPSAELAMVAEEAAMPASPGEPVAAADEVAGEGADGVSAGLAELADTAKTEAPAERKRQTLEKSVAQKPSPAPASKSSARGLSNDADNRRDTNFAYDKKGKLDDSLNTFSTGNASNSPAPTQSPKQDAKPSAKSPAQFAEAAPAAEPMEEAPAKDAYVSAPGSLDAVEDAFSARDWRQVVQSSDAVLEGGGTSVQKARALELKALAYQQMGMVQQALNVYKNIEANYSGYQPDRIRSARNEMERRLNSKPDPSPARKAKSSVDFEDSSLESK